MDETVEIHLDSEKTIKRIFIFLLACELLLIFLDIVVNHHKGLYIGSLRSIRKMVNITREDSIGTWFSSTQMILCGVALFCVALTYKGRNSLAEIKAFRGWSILAAFFTYMGIDDAVKLHERVGSITKILLNKAVDGEGAHPIIELFPTYTWQLVFGPFFGAMGIFIFVFLWKELENRKLRTLLVASLGLYVVAVLLDFYEGMRSPYQGISAYFDTSVAHMTHYSKALEEFLEMLGTSLFLVTFLKKLAERTQLWMIFVSKGSV